MVVIKGLLVLPKTINCKFEVLGRKFSTIIGEEKVTIYFPQFNNECEKNNDNVDFIGYIGLENPLIAPEIACEWPKIRWGYPINYPRKDSQIVSLALLIECDESLEQNIANKIYNEINQWTEAFINYCILESKNIERDKNLLQNTIRLDLIGQNGYIQSNLPINIYLSMIPKNTMLTSKQIEAAMDFASSKKEMHLEYQLLLSAYSFKVRCQNKHAIVDACAAVEYCLNKKIEEYAKEKELNLEIFTDKYRTLGDKFKLVKKLDDSFIKINIKKIVDLRNDIAHNRKNIISDDETDELIREIEKCLAYCSPQYY